MLRNLFSRAPSGLRPRFFSSGAGVTGFKVLGVQQIAVGGASKERLSNLWVDTLGLDYHSTYKSEKENVDEDILECGAGPFKVEVDSKSRRCGGGKSLRRPGAAGAESSATNGAHGCSRLVFSLDPASPGLLCFCYALLSVDLCRTARALLYLSGEPHPSSGDSHAAARCCLKASG